MSIQLRRSCPGRFCAAVDTVTPDGMQVTLLGYGRCRAQAIMALLKRHGAMLGIAVG